MAHFTVYSPHQMLSPQQLCLTSWWWAGGGMSNSCKWLAWPAHLSQSLRAARSAKQEFRTLESLVPTPLSSSLSRCRVAAPSAYTEHQVSVNICSRRLVTQKPESSLPIFFIHARILYFLTPDPSQKLKLCTRHKLWCMSTQRLCLLVYYLDISGTIHNDRFCQGTGTQTAQILEGIN